MTKGSFGTLISANDIQEAGEHANSCSCDVCRRFYNFIAELKNTDWQLIVKY